LIYTKITVVESYCPVIFNHFVYTGYFRLPIPRFHLRENKVQLKKCSDKVVRFKKILFILSVWVMSPRSRRFFKMEILIFYCIFLQLISRAFQNTNKTLTKYFFIKYFLSKYLRHLASFKIFKILKIFFQNLLNVTRGYDVDNICQNEDLWRLMFLSFLFLI